MICVSLREPDFPSLKAALTGLDLAEIRLDAARLSDSEMKSLFSLPVPLVATFRPGGADPGRRLEALSLAVRAGAKYLDLEIESPEDMMRGLIPIARKAGCRLILSYHNQEVTPARRELDGIVDRCRDSGADIIKIACRVHAPADCVRILSLYDRPESLIAFGLGRLGTFTRVAAPFLGAPFTYASLAPGSETGEGQLDWKTLKELLKTLAGR